MTMDSFSCSILLIISFYGTEIFAQEIYTNVWAVKVRGSRQEVEEIALKHGFSYDTHLFEDYHLFKRPGLKKILGKTRLSSEIDKKLDLDSKVEWFMHQKEKQYQLFSSSFRDPMFVDQWYIERLDGPTYNITSVWEAGYTGKGILVAVVDDGVDGNNTELRKNYNLGASYDYVDDVNGKPVPLGKPVSGHGNQCAGVIAGVADNNKCGVGLAYNAKIAGIRLFDHPIKSTDATEARALNHELERVDIYSNSWGPGDMGTDVKGPGPLTSIAIKRGIEKGRGGLGAIYTFAAGNGGMPGDSCAYNGYVNNIYTIAINGANKDGSLPSYAEECPGIMATAYSSDPVYNIGKVITVDSKTCVDNFGQTSAATAMASGLIALTLQSNRNLTWRDLQHVIVNSARRAPVDTTRSQGHWVQNKAGLFVSKFYGFGLMDAGKMVSLAKDWKPVSPLVECVIKGDDKDKDKAIPDKVLITFKNCSIKSLEHVQIKVDLNFTRRGDLSLQLRAPSGTTSTLTRIRKFDNLTGRKNLTNWVITTLFNWGESPIGTWQLDIADFDKRYPSTGTLFSWSLILYGTTSDPLNNNTHVPTKATQQPVTQTHPTTTNSTTKQPSSRIIVEDYYIYKVASAGAAVVVTVLGIVFYICIHWFRENDEEDQKRENTASEAMLRGNERREQEQRETERREVNKKPEYNSLVEYVGSFKDGSEAMV